MSNGRIGTFLSNLMEKSLDALDNAFDEAERSELQSDGALGADIEDQPGFLGDQRALEQSQVQVVPLAMPPLYRLPVIATALFTTVMLALIYSIPIGSLMNGLLQGRNGSSEINAVASINMGLIWLTFLIFPILIAMLLGQRVGLVLGQLLGTMQRNLRTFFILVGIVGLGILYAAQFMDRLIIEPVTEFLMNRVTPEFSTSSVFLVAFVIISVGMVDKYSRLLLGSSRNDSMLGLILGFIPALVGWALVRYASLTLAGGLELVTGTIYVLAAGLMVSGFAALLLYRFGRA